MVLLDKRLHVKNMDKGVYCILTLQLHDEIFSFFLPPHFLLNFILFYFGVGQKMDGMGRRDVKDSKKK